MLVLSNDDVHDRKRVAHRHSKLPAFIQDNFVIVDDGILAATVTAATEPVY